MGVVVDEDDPPSYIKLLRSVASIRHHLADVEYEAIQTARSAGATWQEIADEMNISRQAARSYFSAPKGRRQQPPKTEG